MTKLSKKKDKVSAKDQIKAVCGMAVIIFLFLMLFPYAMYLKNGYYMLATNKFELFKKLCIVSLIFGGPGIALYYVMPPYKNIVKWSITDSFVLAYGIIQIISYCLSDYKAEALWGTKGWYMGTLMQLICILFYFIVSRFYSDKMTFKWFVYASMIGSFILFLWGLLNRFSIYPIEIAGSDSTSFISLLGNINWVCGYWSVFSVMGVALYYVSEDEDEQTWSFIYSAIALALGIVEGSDSGYICLVVGYFFLLIISFRKDAEPNKYLKRWAELVIVISAVCQIMRLITIIFPKSMNRTDAVILFSLGNSTLILLIAAVLFRVYLNKTKTDFSEKKIIADILLILFLVGMISYIVLLWYNTTHLGNIPILKENKLFIFDESWGSFRARTWKDGLIIFGKEEGAHKLFGVGADCFAEFAYTTPELCEMLGKQWESSRLTNAHNELITILVNTGILGVLSFIGIFVSSFSRLVKKSVVNSECLIFAISLLSYFAHNQFSFEQLLNLPYIFIVLGMGEYLLRKEG